MTKTWYIIKSSAGTCEILPNDGLVTLKEPEIVERWGPFASVEEAIARRVGLIRAGKCQPQ
ncbi:MAG: DDE transposase family protein [Geitlerinemataceae cyanobacterium]